MEGVRCECCSKAFSTKRGMKKHLRRAIAKKNASFRCPECNQTFSTKQNLNHHLQGKHLQCPYFCTECNRAIGYWPSSVIAHRKLKGCKTIHRLKSPLKEPNE